MQHIAKVTALDEFNDHEINTELLILSVIVNVENVGMVNFGETLRFTLKTRDKIAISRQLWWQYFNRNAAFQT